MTGADHPRRTLTGRLAVILAVSALLFLGVARPAWAGHVVQWGVDSAGGPDSVESADPVDFEVLVTLDEEPLPGWPMTVRVTADDDTVDEIPIATDDSGAASFTVVPADYPGASNLAIDLCDDDGCDYGSATVVVPVVASPTPTEPAPSTSA